ncbi:MAG: radical SAM protein [Chloroflexi bacterium]|nr:radical SAM protein [Chloroflexota bacterium]
MPFHWSLNPYRGCAHNCAYCYARTTHEFLGLSPATDFSTQIYVKSNIAQRLRSELTRPTWHHESIVIGSATDPYQPAEGRFHLTRDCLEVLVAARNSASLITKGTLVVRDLDVLQELNRQARLAVNISLITLDKLVWQTIEPGTPPPESRLRALARIAGCGIPCGIALAPVLPRLTDNLDQLAALLRSAVDHGAQWAWTGTLHLEPAVRDVLLDSVARHFPHLTASYARVYGHRGSRNGARYTPTPYEAALRKRINRFTRDLGLAGEEHQSYRPRPSGIQQSEQHTVAGPRSLPLPLD